MKKNHTGERLETFVLNGNSVLHLHRYQISENFIVNKRVLDIASGEGYGTSLLSKKAKFIYGVDIDELTIIKAKKKYKKENLEFLVGNTSSIPLCDNSVDVVISFETIEHHNEHEQMIMEIKRVLTDDGLLIISTPDKLHYSDNRNYTNSFHVKELYKSQFIELIKLFFKKSQLLNQSYLNGNSLLLDNKTQGKMQFYSGHYLQLEKRVVNPMYLILIASNNEFLEQESSLFDGSGVDKEIKNKRVYAVKNSIAFKVGLFILLLI